MVEIGLVDAAGAIPGDWVCTQMLDSVVSPDSSSASMERSCRHNIQFELIPDITSAGAQHMCGQHMGILHDYALVTKPLLHLQPARSSLHVRSNTILSGLSLTV